MQGMMNAFATAISLGLQCRVPLEGGIQQVKLHAVSRKGSPGNPDCRCRTTSCWLASPVGKQSDFYREQGIADPGGPQPRKPGSVPASNLGGSGSSSPAGNGGNRNGNGGGGGGEQRPHRPRVGGPGRRYRQLPPVLAGTALTDDVPVVDRAPLRSPDRAGPACDSVRRHDATNQRLLPAAVLRQQHRMWMNHPGLEFDSFRKGPGGFLDEPDSYTNTRGFPSSPGQPPDPILRWV